MGTGDENTDSGLAWEETQETTTTATSADFSLHGATGIGVRILYSLALTSNQIREGQLESGAMWSVESEDD